MKQDAGGGGVGNYATSSGVPIRRKAKVWLVSHRLALALDRHHPIFALHCQRPVAAEAGETVNTT